MEKQIEEKRCESCRFYNRLYIKLKNRLLPLTEGHCIKKHYKKHPPVLCSFWEDVSIKNESQIISIISAVLKMEKTLDEIKLILKDNDIQSKLF